MAKRQEMKPSPFKVFMYLCLVGFVLLLVIGLPMLADDKYIDDDQSLPGFHDVHSDDSKALSENIREPIILWWTGFTGEPGAYRKCGKKSCFFTIDRHYRNHHQTKVLMFYGSDFSVKDLPIPRKPHHDWGLLHEESPKNNYLFSHAEALELFNHTCTFKRQSDFPITTQYLDSLAWLTSTDYVVPTSEKNEHLHELAPLIFTHSDCNVPSDRDNYVTMLMKEMAVDSYGSCLHNKDLPSHLVDPIKGMAHEDFYQIAAKYKFTLALENAVCDDYVTEKLWRPLMLGSVPVVFGSPKIRDILPNNHSAILVEDFASVKALADYLKFLNSHDEEYEKYLAWKKTGVTNNWLLDLMEQRTWSITESWKYGRTNFIEDFECFVCNRVHSNTEKTKRGSELKYQANIDHYGCPQPKQFNAAGKYVKDESTWQYDWKHKLHQAKALRYFADKNKDFSKGDFKGKVSEIRYNSS